MTDAAVSAAVSPFGPPADETHLVEIARELAVDFAARAPAYDESGEVPIDNMRALHESGLDTAVLPREHGGQGASFRMFGQALGLIAEACPSTACIWLMHVGAAITLVELGPPPMAEFYAAEWVAGRRFANALSEPTSGNLFLMPLQHAEATEGGWTLSGAKRFVSGCEIADHFLVNALVDGVPNFFGVARDHTISFVPIWDTMGLRATRSQLVSLDGTLLRADRRCLPPELDRPHLIGAGLPWLSIGVARAALGALRAHARGRVIPTTGQSLAHMQWVQFAVAEAHVGLQAATTLAERLMWLADMRSPEYMPASLEAKLAANQMAKQVAELGMKVGGASGYLRTSPIQRHFRDAQAGALMAYSVEVCSDVIGKAVLGIDGADESTPE